jgi:hypothetical protein
VDDLSDPHPEFFPQMFATFHYGGEVRDWIVPDVKLFRMLCRYLMDEAEVKDLSECVAHKLYISKESGKWSVIND